MGILFSLSIFNYEILLEHLQAVIENDKLSRCMQLEKN